MTNELQLVGKSRGGDGIGDGIGDDRQTATSCEIEGCENIDKNKVIDIEDYTGKKGRRIGQDSSGTSVASGQTASSSDYSSQEQEKGAPVDIKSLDWDSEDDKDNPRNWSTLRKWYVTYTVGLICLCVTLGSSLYVSGVPEISSTLGVSQQLAVSGLTFYLIGLAFGPAIAAPLSEVFGRRWIYLISLPVSMLFTMGVGLSKTIYSILILRFFSGFIASPALSVAVGSISDLWDTSEIGFAMSTFCLAPFLGPVLGPVIGGFTAEHKGWEWTMWVSLIISGAALIPVVFLPETYKPAILESRAKKRGIAIDKPPVDMAYFKRVALITLIRPTEMLFVEPIVCVLSIYVAFVFAVLFAFFESYPVIFEGSYHMDMGVSGLPFLGIGVGLLAGVSFYVVLDRYVYSPKNPDGTRGKRDENGGLIMGSPESKLLPAKIGAVCLPISLFWLGWTGRTGNIHWIVPALAGVPFGFGLVTIFVGVVFYFSMTFPPESVASALAANNLLRYIVASVFPLFVVQMYHKLNIGWASSLFGFVALLMVPVPFVFEKYGALLRSSSKYGYAAHFKRLDLEKSHPKPSQPAPGTDVSLKA